VSGDLTTVFNFQNPNGARTNLPSTDGFLPPVNELSGGDVTTFIPTQNQVIIGLPKTGEGRAARHGRCLTISTRTAN